MVTVVGEAKGVLQGEKEIILPSVFTALLWGGRGGTERGACSEVGEVREV